MLWYLKSDIRCIEVLGMFNGEVKDFGGRSKKKLYIFREHPHWKVWAFDVVWVYD